MEEKDPKNKIFNNESESNESEEESEEEEEEFDELEAIDVNRVWIAFTPLLFKAAGRLVMLYALKYYAFK